jgi:hypothetical protein
MPLEDGASLEDLVAALRLLKPVQIARLWREALMLSNEHRDGFVNALTALGGAVNWFELPVAGRKRLLARRDWVRVERLLRAVTARLAEGAFDWAAHDTDAAALRESGLAPRALLTGDELIASGMKPGPRFKDILRDVYRCFRERGFTAFQASG